MADELWSILRKRIRDDGVPPWSLAIILCIVATLDDALEEINRPDVHPEDTRNHVIDLFFDSTVNLPFAKWGLRGIAWRSLLPD